MLLAIWLDILSAALKVRRFLIKESRPSEFNPAVLMVRIHDVQADALEQGHSGGHVFHWPERVCRRGVTQLGLNPEKRFLRK
jgi:hypothetical protein